MNSLINFFRLIYQYRYTIWVMSLQEIRAKYTGSLLGGFWSVIHPLVMVFIYWMVFSVGFKVSPTKNIPFLSWFFSAFVAWQSFSDSLVNSSGSLLKNRYLIKKTIFPSQILPLISILANLINSIILIVILIIMLLVQGVPIPWYALQVFYYMFALFFLSLGVGWFFSAASVLLRDVSQLVSVILQVLFWSTPIFYKLDYFPEKYWVYFKLNPIYYLTEGFRDSFLYGIPFWSHPALTVYFWGISLFCFIFGGWFFKKTKQELADII